MLRLMINDFVKKWFNVRRTTRKNIQSIKDMIFHSGMIFITAVLIIWLCIFLYIAFYYAYMPNMSYMRSINMNFKSCNEEKGICSFPQAHVQLTKKQQFLMVGQPYKINLHLEMPESPANKELGMFMVCAQLRSRDGFLVDHTCRSAMLHYRSTLLNILTTLTFFPMMIFGDVEEKQNVNLELFNNFEEDQNHPVTIIFIEIQSRHIEFYSANLMINAHLSGLRYWMFYWPILSAVVGISTFLFFITFVFTLSYLHFRNEEQDIDECYEKSDMEDEKDLKINDHLKDENIEEEKSISKESSYIQELTTESSSSEI